MKLRRLCASALATSMSVGLIATAAPMAHAATDNPVHNAAQDAFNYWAPRLMKSSPSFTIPGASESGEVKWALPVTDSPELLDAAAQSDAAFRQALDNPRKLRDLTGGVDKITPAVSDDGALVVVLPFDKASVDAGRVVLSNLLAGTMIQATQDKESQVPIGAPDNAIRLLYDVVVGGESKTTGFDLVDALKPVVTIANREVAYNNGKKSSPEFESITNLAITPINPETRNVITESMRVLNGQGDVTSILEVLRTPNEGEKGDPSKGGLVPVQGADGKPLKQEKGVDSDKESVEHTIEFVSPKEGDQVYLMHRVVDAKGNDVVQPDMRTLSALKPTLDVQASSQEGSRKLVGEDKQTIYNQAKVRQLTPGKPYQVLVNLSQCNPTDGCTEIAAVNREIIPRDTTERTENFAVDIDTSNVDENNTFEWSTSVFEGTGDVKKMGEKLAAVDDHPGAQVLSFSGDATSLNKTGAGERAQQHSNEGKLEIKDEAPPVPMEDVRKNNESLDADSSEDSSAKVWGIGIVAGLLGVIVVPLFAVFAWRNRSSNVQAGEK